MIAAVLAGAVMAGCMIRPALNHDDRLPITVTGRRRHAAHTNLPAAN